jgi:bis(5'-nucleosyl)-tetraphosphatase (symmetrical)
LSAPIYAIGDVQGCLDALLALIDGIDRRAAPDATAATAAPRAGTGAVRPANGLAGEAARLWLVGDLVNRGPRSLATLRWAIANERRITTVLGNHDLHLLAVAAGIRPMHRSDTLAEILAAPDAAELIDWVRRRPLAHLENGHLMVHAGVLPQWSAQRTLEVGAEVQQVLSGPRWMDFVRVMYGNEPARWDEGLSGADRLRVIVNALTRLRFCTPDGTMDFRAKQGADSPPPGHLPWFDVPGRASDDVTVVFGHWSTLGLVMRPNLLALDTGCVWGGALTAVRLGDRGIAQVRCAAAMRPGD